MQRVHKEVKEFLIQARQQGVKMTVASKMLLDHAKNTGFDVNTLPLKKFKRRGTVLDLLSMMYALFGFSIAIVIGYFMMTQFASNPILTSTTQANASMQTMLQGYLVFDNLFLAVLMGLSLSSVVASTLLKTSPVWFFLSVVLLALLLVVGAVVSNSYSSFIDANTQLNISSQAFPKMNLIMNNLLLYLAVMGTLIIIGLYSFRGQQI